MALRIAGEVAYVEGDVTLDQVTGLLAEARKALGQGVRRFDLSGVRHMDSSALSLLLSLRRQGQVGGVAPGFESLPESLLSLAALYGVTDLL